MLSVWQQMRTALFYLLIAFTQLLFSPYPLSGRTGRIYGTVQAADTREPLPYANIYLDSTPYGTVSDVNGFFSIIGVPPGRYSLITTYIGYRSFKKTVEVRSDKGKSLEVILEPAPVQVDSVLVTANRNRNRYDIPVGLITLDFRQMKHTPIAAEPDLFRVLETFPGVTTVNDFNVGLYVRGGGRDQNQILLDGIPIYNPYHALSIFSTFDAEAAKQIDLHKSGMDPSYGNSLSSVLDVHTRDGRADRMALRTNVSLLSSKLLVEGPHPLGTYMFSVRHTYIDWAVDLLRLVRIIPKDLRFPYSFVDGIGSIIIKPTPTNRLKATAYWGRDEYRISDIDNDPDSGDMVWGNLALGLAWDRLISPNLSVHANLALSRYLANWLPADTTSPYSINHRVVSRILRGYLQYKSDLWGKLRLGTEVRPATYLMKVKGLSHQPVWLDSTDARELSSFVTINRNLGSRLSVKLGGRATHFAYQDTIVYSPQASLRFRAGSNSDVSFHWGRYHQGVMTVGNEEIILSMFDAWRPVPRDMPVMHAQHYVAETHIYPAVGYEISINVYLKNMMNVAEYNPRKYIPEDPDFVTGQGRALGFELLLKKGIGDLQGWLSYGYGQVEKTVLGVTYPPKYDKPHDLNVVASWPLSKRWRMSSRFVYHSGTPFTPILGYYEVYVNTPHLGSGHSGSSAPIYGTRNSFRTPPYHRLDLKFTRTITTRRWDYEFYLDIMNVYARLNVLGSSSINEFEIQMPPILTFGLRGAPR